MQAEVKPEALEGRINLPNQQVKVGTNAVDNSGKQASVKEIIKNLKRAAREQLFPPMVNPQNG